MKEQSQKIRQDHPVVKTGRIGVLLVNLGTPDEPTPKAVKRYLAEFLSDRRVIEIPQLLWQPILRGVILNTRPRKSAAAYQKVWTDDGSPLAVITRAQAKALGSRLVDQFIVRHAMRYGNPALGAELRRMQEEGCDRILIAPLYPQYCGATTASVVDKVHEELGRMRWQPALRFLPPYYDDPAYIDALSSEIERQIAALDFDPELLLLSYHGMPQRTFDLGDPYYCHCQKTSRLLGERLGHGNLRISTTFQSRFGKAKWLEPATDRTLVSQAQAGVRNIAIVAPGFSADCVETLEELAIVGREQFIAAGGENFAVLSCLNDKPAGMDMIEALVRRELSGWN